MTATDLLAEIQTDRAKACTWLTPSTSDHKPAKASTDQPQDQQ